MKKWHRKNVLYSRVEEFLNANKLQPGEFHILPMVVRNGFTEHIIPIIYFAEHESKG